MGAVTRALLAAVLLAGCTATARDVCETTTDAWCERVAVCEKEQPMCRKRAMASCCTAYDCEQEVSSEILSAAKNCAHLLVELDCRADPMVALPKACRP